MLLTCNLFRLYMHEMTCHFGVCGGCGFGSKNVTLHPCFSALCLCDNLEFNIFSITPFYFLFIFSQTFTYIHASYCLVAHFYKHRSTDRAFLSRHFTLICCLPHFRVQLARNLLPKTRRMMKTSPDQSSSSSPTLRSRELKRRNS